MAAIQAGKPVLLVWLLLAFALAEAAADLVARAKRPGRARGLWPAAGAIAHVGAGALDLDAGGADGPAAVPPVLPAHRVGLDAGAADRVHRRPSGAGRPGPSGFRRRRRAHRALQRRQPGTRPHQHQQPGAVGGGGVGGADHRAVPVL
ncbi:hypothetical protein G6F68_016881 [Rhizopus microsporus]|nr:hypothetical protein G6F68_016881 [Rhizopus microsporus]